MNTMVDDAIGILWNYTQLKQPVTPADVMVVLGSRDDRVAVYAASLLKQGVAPTCIVTGGIAHGNDLLAASWQERSEAEHFINIMKAAGVPGDMLIAEDNATNTGQNAMYSYRVLKTLHVTAQTILLVTKPYMERRALATFNAQWSDKATTFHVTSQGGPIEQYCNDEQTYADVVNIMVGDFQRIMEYPKLGFQTAQIIPQDVVRAYEVLRRSGFTKHILLK